MDVVWMIVFATIVLGFLVLIHEGGHYLAARAFGVRVTEFMIGFPGPSIGFTWHGTRFGLTCVPLGGYARVCGMEPGEESPSLRSVLPLVYREGAMSADAVSERLGISVDEALGALDELVEWGSLIAPRRRDEEGLYRAPALAKSFAAGEARPVEDPEALYLAERSMQYRSLPFWKRCMILLSGPLVNILFAVIAFVLIYSVLGFDYTDQATGQMSHMTVDPGRAIMAGFNYIGLVLVSIAQLFNPATAAATVSNSTSIMGIAVLSKNAADAGFTSFLTFTAMISVSLGLMNMLPIPPLDGGRFVVEIYQKIARRDISIRALNYLSFAGMAFFLALFAVMLNQDIQRFIFGNWG